MKTEPFRCGAAALPAAMLLALLLQTPSTGTGREYGPESNTNLAAQVTIRRDSYGVPHILAETEEAAAFGMGYAQAEDYCVEVARRFVGARGEEAKYLGTGVENDFRMKRYGNYEVAAKNFGLLSPLFQKMMDAYAAGLNLYVEKHRKELPAWIPVFDGVDVLARGRAEVMRFAFNEASIRAVQIKYPSNYTAQAAQPDPHAWSTGASVPELEELDLPFGEGEQTAQPVAPSTLRRVSPSQPLWGSNMWAISGSRTVSGKPILLGNPHQPWASLYWEAQVTVPGKINFFGGTFIGRPVLTTGFNEYLGWTHTVNYPDLDDIYALKADPASPDRYIFDGKSMPLTKKELSVEIKQDDGTLRTERRVYWYSHLGPVVHRAGAKIFAIRSVIFDEFRYYEEWYALSKTRNLQEFLSILRMNAIPMFNLSYADVNGNILYVWNGTVPKRVDDGMDYRLDVPAETGKYVWRSLHKLEELPQLLNPGGGYVQNCNDAPWYTSLKDRLEPAKYPSYFEPGRQLKLRTQMSLAMLEGQQKFSLDDVKRLKFNTTMLLAERVKPDLISALKHAANPSEAAKTGLAVMEAWDNHVSADSRGAILFQRFWDGYGAATSKPFAVAWDARNPARTPYGISDPQLAVTKFEEAVQWTRKTYGSESAAWGDVYRIRLSDLDLPGDGASELYGLFRVVTFSPAHNAKDAGKYVVGVAQKGKPYVGGGDGWIMAIEFSRPLKAYSLLAYGETGNPASRHNSDQAQLFADHKFKPVWFAEADINANLERAYHPRE